MVPVRCIDMYDKIGNAWSILWVWSGFGGGLEGGFLGRFERRFGEVFAKLFGGGFEGCLERGDQNI